MYPNPIEQLQQILPAAEYIEELHSRKKALQQEIVSCNAISSENENSEVVMKIVFLIACGILAFFGFFLFINAQIMETVLVWIGAIICFFAFLLTGRGREERKNECMKKCGALASEIQAIDAELERCVQEVLASDMFSVVPPDYFYSDAIRYFITALRKTVAQNLHEAILLYENELSRIRSEQLQMELCAQQVHSQQVLAEAMEMRTFMLWMLSDRR